MWTKNKTGFKNTLEFPKNDFKERSPELLREKNEHSPRKKIKERNSQDKSKIGLKKLPRKLLLKTQELAQVWLPRSTGKQVARNQDRRKGFETWSHKDLRKGQCTCSHHQSREIVGPARTLCNLTAKSSAEHFGFWVVAFTLAKFQKIKIVLPKTGSFMWPTRKNVVRTRNLNQTCFSAERNWYHPEKVRVPFFLEL